MASWRKRIATGFKWLWNGVRLMLFTVFAVVSAIGLWHSWTAKGSVDDRRAELHRLEERLLEQLCDTLMLLTLSGWAAAVLAMSATCR